jgi:hypothetical protein
MKSIRLITLLAELSNYQPSATVKGHQKNRKTFSRLLMKQTIDVSVVVNSTALAASSMLSEKSDWSQTCFN